MKNILLHLTRIRREPVAGRTLGELIFGMLLIDIILAVIGTAVLPGRWFFLLGITVGTAFAIALLINMYDSIEAALSMNERRARSYGSLHGALRIAVTAGFLGLAIWLSVYSFVGAALAVASIKVSGLLHTKISVIFSKMLGEQEPRKDVPENVGETVNTGESVVAGGEANGGGSVIAAGNVNTSESAGTDDDEEDELPPFITKRLKRR